MCETTIEKELIYEKGVKSVDLDLSTNVVKVEYDERKTTPEAIKVALTKLGYHADELPGDAKALLAALRNLGSYDAGGFTVTYGPEQNHGSKYV
jgi:copper chaperone CopZ